MNKSNKQEKQKIAGPKSKDMNLAVSISLKAIKNKQPLPKNHKPDWV